jgi:lipoate-protein ligase A
MTFGLCAFHSPANFRSRYNTFMQPDTWRVIFSKSLEGAWNMAVDEAILEAVGRGISLPTLRLYAWQPPCLSLGYAQPVTDVDIQALGSSGWNLVRRPTGGRAILHTDELTYAVIAPLNEQRVAGGVLESYRRLAQGLLQALQFMGLPAQADQAYPLPPGAQLNGAVCFEVPSNYEITANGKKIIGSSQARRLSGVLQHGSLPLTGDLARITNVLQFQTESDRAESAIRLLDHATTLEAVLNRVVAWDEAADCFKRAFEQCLDLKLEIDHLSGFELKRAAELVKEKYGNLTWTNRF